MLIYVRYTNPNLLYFAKTKYSIFINLKNQNYSKIYFFQYLKNMVNTINLATLHTTYVLA